MHVLLHCLGRVAPAGAEAASVVLPTVYLAAVGLPLLLTVVAVGLRLAAAVAARIDGRAADAGPLTPVTELPSADELSSLPQVIAPPASAPAPASPPPAGEVPAPRRGPLQLVDEAAPSTKLCPDCAETVLGSARVCQHCHFRFEPPLQGSWAV